MLHISRTPLYCSERHCENIVASEFCICWKSKANLHSDRFTSGKLNTSTQLVIGKSCTCLFYIDCILGLHTFKSIFSCFSFSFKTQIQGRRETYLYSLVRNKRHAFGGSSTGHAKKTHQTPSLIVLVCHRVPGLFMPPKLVARSFPTKCGL